MKLRVTRVVLACLLLSIGTPALGSETEDDAVDDRQHPVRFALLYLPNRVFDLLDVVRARVRVGPGIAVGARATEFADLFVGSYTSLWVGLPGPRGGATPNLPLGLEMNHGIEVSVADGSTGLGFAPDYGLLEAGAGLQAAIIGFDLGIDPLEVLDLLGGFVGLDPVGDDL